MKNASRWVIAVLGIAAAAQALEAGRKVMTITYDDGSTQSVPLKRPSSAIARIEYGEGGPGEPTHSESSGGRPGDAVETYTDRGHEISVPCGENSFVSRVVSYRIGNPAPAQNYQNPKTALGPPDYVNDETPGHEVSLGCEGSIILEFERVRLVDKPGPDIHVFETGSAIEATRLEISADGQQWVDIGRISGGTASVDIQGHVAPGQQFRFVRLTDLRSVCGGNWPGADIDAVAAVGCVPVKH